MATPNQTKGSVKKVPYFPETPGVAKVCKLLFTFPDINLHRVIHRLYPYNIICDTPEIKALDLILLRSFGPLRDDSQYSYHVLKDKVTSTGLLEYHQQQVRVDIGEMLPISHSLSSFVKLREFERILSEMAEDHWLGVDVCIVSVYINC